MQCVGGRRHEHTCSSPVFRVPHGELQPCDNRISSSSEGGLGRHRCLGCGGELVMEGMRQSLEDSIAMITMNCLQIVRELEDGWGATPEYPDRDRKLEKIHPFSSEQFTIMNCALSFVQL